MIRLGLTKRWPLFNRIGDQLISIGGGVDWSHLAARISRQISQGTKDTRHTRTDSVKELVKV